MKSDELRVEDVLRDSLCAEMEDTAEKYREAIADRLEYLADEVRSGDFDPTFVVAVLVQPDVPTIRFAGDASWEALKEAHSILGDAYRVRTAGGDLGAAMQAGWHRRRKVEWKLERDQVAKELERPHKCDHCSFRSKSQAGLTRHNNRQKEIGCECGTPRCARGGMVYRSGDEELGRYICAHCLEKARAKR